MKSNIILSKLNCCTASVLLLSAVIVSGAFMMTACESDNLTEDTNTKSSNGDTSNEDDLTSNQTDINEGTKIDIEIDPSLLDEADKLLSLEGHGAKGAFLDKDLSIADMLMYAIQDEHLARGEYQAIMDKFGNQTPYSKILRSENMHISSLEEIYKSYKMDIPKDTSAEHIVTPENLLESAKTGVQAEIDNIAMYEKFMTYDLPEGIKEVFTALMNASKSHLIAFERQVDRLSN